MERAYENLVASAQKGGKVRARTLTPEERSEIARTAASARWERYRAERGLEAALVFACEAPPNYERVRNVDFEAFQEVVNRVESHTPSDTCPCDDCYQLVVDRLTKRYRSVLEKVDRGERVDKEDAAFFSLVIGERPTRWTGIFRAEQRKKSRPT